MLLLMTFDPLIESTDEQLVLEKHFLNRFLTYTYKHTTSALKLNMFTYKKIQLFYSTTHFLLFALSDL